jgi:fructose-bisphosphate aldolase/2-amino-3,7-dideoxy-D-threo-hept-6-ulosonate synthase
VFCLSLVGKKLRLNRIFNGKSGRTLIVAIDHGVKFGVLKGLENPLETTKLVIEGGADGVIATPAIAKLIDRELSDAALIIRVDGGATIAGPDITNDNLIASVTDALILGADGVIAFGYVGVEREAQQLRKLGFLAKQCERWGIPLIAEMLTSEIVSHHFKGDTKREYPTVENLKLACRVGAEMGADLIKTCYSGEIDTFKEVVNGCPVTILVLGGPATDTIEGTLRMARDAMEAGAKGIVMGRNIWQRENPGAITRSLAKIIHENASVEEALRELNKV